MGDDKEAVREAAYHLADRAAEPRPITHYFYFPVEREATRAAERLRAQGYTASCQKSVDGPDWLVLAAHNFVLTETSIETLRAAMEEIASRHGGEYDGWEVDVAS